MSSNSNDPFTQKKRFILEQIGSPDGTDLSPKGSIDEPLLDLIRLINTHPDMVTTSSCSGRLSVFLEGSKHHLGGGAAMSGTGNDGQQQVQKVGGKGLGGKWLYISHEPETINSEAWWQTVKETNELDEDEEISKEDLENRYVLYKFEAMVSFARLCFFFFCCFIAYLNESLIIFLFSRFCMSNAGIERLRISFIQPPWPLGSASPVSVPTTSWGSAFR